MSRAGALWVIMAAAFAGCEKPPAAPAPASAPTARTEPFPESSPRDAWESRQRARLSGDAKGVWESLCAASRAEKLRTQETAMDDMRRLDDDSLAKALHPYGVDPSKFRKMTPEEFCLHMIGRSSQVAAPAKERMKAQEFVKAEVVGRTAICTISSPGGGLESLVMVAEGGFWKLDDLATARMRIVAPGK